MLDGAIFWGVVKEIKGDQIKVESKTIDVGLVDLITPYSATKEVCTLVKKDDPVLVFSFGGTRVAMLGAPGGTLELQEGVFDEIKYSNKTSIKVEDKKITVKGFEEMTIDAKTQKFQAKQVELGRKVAFKTGVVTQQCLCAFTGAIHPEASTAILAEK